MKKLKNPDSQFLHQVVPQLAGDALVPVFAGFRGPRRHTADVAADLAWPKQNKINNNES